MTASVIIHNFFLDLRYRHYFVIIIIIKNNHNNYFASLSVFTRGIDTRFKYIKTKSNDYFKKGFGSCERYF